MTSNPVPQSPAFEWAELDIPTTPTHSDEEEKRLRNQFQESLCPNHIFLVDMPNKGWHSECVYGLCPEPERKIAMNGDDYRITVGKSAEPGKKTTFYASARHYHVACFALLVDLHNVENVNRLVPLTPATRRYRSSSWEQMVDTGAEHLVWRWRELMYEWNKKWQVITTAEVPALREFDNFGRDSAAYPKLNPAQLSPAKQDYYWENRADYRQYDTFFERFEDAVRWTL
ncbi:hypothetical protein PG996_006143 [Apiospora saccharicola]|uniref:Uncharacterized protein n=1 Tax=Apiospora saccharicola TaxID=335842 RepID=A0ABR1VNI1_9PEZI